MDKENNLYHKTKEGELMEVVTSPVAGSLIGKSDTYMRVNRKRGNHTGMYIRIQGIVFYFRNKLKNV